jgi:putative transposase
MFFTNIFYICWQPNLNTIMPNTYTQIFIHYVFAVQDRLCLINHKWKDELYRYMIGIVEKHESKVYSINGMPDHLHILVSMNPKHSPSDLMYEVKRSSSLWINEKKFIRTKFSWQEGFGAFSYSKSQIPDIADYIANQEAHHKTRSFMEEYKSFLELYGIDYDKRYVFKPIK